MRSTWLKGLAVGGTLLALSACGGNDEAKPVPLPVLAENPAAYDGERVVTQGVVRRFDAPLHYWIEDQDLHRVELFPHEVIAPHLGRDVRVVGRFSFSPDEGRQLVLESVTPWPREE